MDELIQKYRKTVMDLKREYLYHREKDAIKTYLYGKILTYERVINDLLTLQGKPVINDIGVF